MRTGARWSPPLSTSTVAGHHRPPRSNVAFLEPLLVSVERDGLPLSAVGHRLTLTVLLYCCAESFAIGET